MAALSFSFVIKCFEFLANFKPSVLVASYCTVALKASELLKLYLRFEGMLQVIHEYWFLDVFDTEIV